MYDALAADYDRFVNWPARLEHELPFIERVFARHRVRRVLDTACGTGHHAIALAQRGYQVTGTDLSAPMVARARDNARAAGVEVDFAVAGLGSLSSQGQALDTVSDAALCLGNSLPHLTTDEELTGALDDFAAVLRPGGLLIIQNRNFDRVWAERERFMGPQSYRRDEDEWLFVRFYDFHEGTLTFNMLRLRRTAEGWSQDAQSTELWPLFSRDLTAALAAAGFGSITFYGGYDGATFEPGRSGDLIAVAIRD